MRETKFYTDLKVKHIITISYIHGGR